MAVEPGRPEKQSPPPPDRQSPPQARARMVLADEIEAFFHALSLRRIARWTLVLALLYGLWWLIQTGSSAMPPFIVGIVLAYLLLPLVNRLNTAMPRWAAIIVVYFIGIVAVSSFFGYVVPLLIDQISQLIQTIPSLAQLETQVDSLLAFYQRFITNLPPQVREPLESGINQAITTAQNNIALYARNVGSFLLDTFVRILTTVTSTVGFLLGFVLIPFWLFYVLNDQQKGIRALDRLLPARIRADFWVLVKIIDQVFSSYVRAQIILGLAVGSSAGLGLLLLRLFGFNVNYILLLAVIAGFTELIPVIGPILGAIPAIIVGLFDSPTTGLAVVILYIVIQQLENNFLVPRIVGESVDIHPAILMVLLVVASQVFGLLGAILSAPFAAVVRDIFVYLYGRLSEPPAPAGVMPVRPKAEPPEPAPAPKRKTAAQKQRAPRK